LDKRSIIPGGQLQQIHWKSTLGSLADGEVGGGGTIPFFSGKFKYSSWRLHPGVVSPQRIGCDSPNMIVEERIIHRKPS